MEEALRDGFEQVAGLVASRWWAVELAAKKMEVYGR
jgi:hypothetical protein